MFLCCCHILRLQFWSSIVRNHFGNQSWFSRITVAGILMDFILPVISHVVIENIFLIKSMEYECWNFLRIRYLISHYFKNINSTPTYTIPNPTAELTNNMHGSRCPVYSYYVNRFLHSVVCSISIQVCVN